MTTDMVAAPATQRIDHLHALRELIAAAERGLPSPRGIKFEHRDVQLTVTLRTFADLHDWRRECDTDDLRQQTERGWDYAYAGASWRGMRVLLIAAEPERTALMDSADRLFPLSRDERSDEVVMLAELAGVLS